ncbi:DUF6143 family protein [Paenibacillus montanisoli]|uniref:Uncharacterized protein n=1 Tax=Paenibacillus montanisoli TaxID=2081970 RepID=A0A328TTD9_9BACL|nr:DUF6143 family protein [Paenibacillus montanisoli]RAP73827.1 hypothetical protein DL346_26615 [Paenibacillus montanisoli]
MNKIESIYGNRLGQYFLGQTGLLTFGDGKHAWGGVFNPSDSGIRVAFDLFTVTNYSPEPCAVECWLGNLSLGRGSLSRHVASVNQPISPVPMPKAELRDADRLSESPADGRFSFVQLADSKSTTTTDLQGMLILPPGCSIIAFLRSQERGTIRARVAFGWWEDSE